MAWVAPTQVLYLSLPRYAVELTREEEAAARGERGEVQEMAYRILVAAGEAAGAERLVPIRWAHLSGVNYNTIGDAGEGFLADLSRKEGARVRVRTTLNPAGFDPGRARGRGVDDDFAAKQASIRGSYGRMGVIPSFSCIPYEIFELPERGSQVAFAESNAAIHANSVDGLRTDRESAFSALASALTGKSPYSAARRGGGPGVTVRVGIRDPDEVACGLAGLFAGRAAAERGGGHSVTLSGMPAMDRRSCKSLCGGMGTSGTCAMFELGEGAAGSERVDFGEEEMRDAYDEINTAERGDLVALGSPQLGLGELRDLAAMLKGRSFRKDCMVFCPRAAAGRARELGYAGEIERAGGEILSDCCACLTPLVDPREVDAVTTNSIKGGYYLKNSTGVGVNLKPLSRIVRDETR